MNSTLIQEAELLSAHLLDIEWEWIPDADPDSDAGRICTVELDSTGQPELQDVVEGDACCNLIFSDVRNREFVLAAPRLVRGLLAEVERLREVHGDLARALKVQHEGARHG